MTVCASDPGVQFVCGLSDVSAIIHETAELTCKLSSEECDGVWFRDGKKVSCKGQTHLLFGNRGIVCQEIALQRPEIPESQYFFSFGIKRKMKLWPCTHGEFQVQVKIRCKSCNSYIPSWYPRDLTIYLKKHHILKLPKWYCSMMVNIWKMMRYSGEILSDTTQLVTKPFKPSSAPCLNN